VAITTQQPAPTSANEENKSRNTRHSSRCQHGNNEQHTTSPACQHVNHTQKDIRYDATEDDSGRAVPFSAHPDLRHSLQPCEGTASNNGGRKQRPQFNFNHRQSSPSPSPIENGESPRRTFIEISSQQSEISSQQSAISNHQSAISNHRSAISSQQSAISSQQSAVNNQQPAVRDKQPAANSISISLHTDEDDIANDDLLPN
jgi:hypothetical protein